MPAPLKNRNAYRHGLRSNQTSDPVVNNQLRAFRRSIREELAGVNGLPTVAQEALLQSAVRHETRALLAGHYLRRETKLPVARRMELLAAISAATAERDKILRQLGIVGSINGKAAGGSDLWDALDEAATSPADASGDASPAAEPSHAANGRQRGSQAKGEPDPRLPTPNGEPPDAVIQDHPAGEATAELRPGDCHASEDRTRAEETPQGLATKAGKPV